MVLQQPTHQPVGAKDVQQRHDAQHRRTSVADLQLRAIFRQCLRTVQQFPLSAQQQPRPPERLVCQHLHRHQAITSFAPFFPTAWDFSTALPIFYLEPSNFHAVYAHFSVMALSCVFLFSQPPHLLRVSWE